MRILKLGTFGSDVKSWQIFLRGMKENSLVVSSSYFDVITKEETIEFQKLCGLSQDGIVGQNTINEATKRGYKKIDDIKFDFYSEKPLTLARRKEIFGEFSYRAAPTKDNPENIEILDGWERKNIVTIDIPQLSKVHKSCKVTCNKRISNQIKKVFADWEAAGLLNRIITWDGMWTPRYIRGSRVTLSNHAWGTAFDINARWNPLGAAPAGAGEQGSVIDLVEIAYKNGLYWGGMFGGRPDGMHFEIFKIIGENDER